MNSFEVRRRREAAGNAWVKPRTVLVLVLVLLVSLEVFMLLRTSSSGPLQGAGVHHVMQRDIESEQHPASPPPPQQQRQQQQSSREAAPPRRTAHEPPEPDLAGLMDRIRTALLPFMVPYMMRHDPDLVGQPCPEGKLIVSYDKFENSYLGGCPASGCHSRTGLKAAQKLCTELGDECGGVTQTSAKRYEVRSENAPSDSTSLEVSWVKKLGCPPGPAGETVEPKFNVQPQTPTARRVWEAFLRAMDEALSDESLHLSSDFGPPRDDDSIYLSIASYRDPSCRASLRKAFERADTPEKLFAGIVQQNCDHDCMTGTGWANTRRWGQTGRARPRLRQGVL